MWNTRFSIGYNDWGLDLMARPQLGLGGDIAGAFYQGPVTDKMVVAPSQMVALGDLPATQDPTLIVYNANLDPTDTSEAHSQRPANRHDRRTNLLFTDGHNEAPFRNDVIAPTAGNPWRSRWNNHNKPHNEITWTLGDTSQVDP